MKTTIQYLSAILIASTILIGCKKNDTGGKAAIHVRVTHAGQAVTGANTVYVKFKANSEPASPKTNYDLKVEGEAGENHIHIEGLRPGKYYVYTSSFEENSTKELNGGSAITINWSEKELMKDVVIETVHD